MTPSHQSREWDDCMLLQSKPNVTKTASFHDCKTSLIVESDFGPVDVPQILDVN